MAWVRYDDRFTKHPKVRKAGKILGGRYGLTRVVSLHHEATEFCNVHLTDGVITREDAAQFDCDPNPVEVLNVLALKSVGLVERVRGGWKLHDYHDYQPAADDIKDRRMWDAARQRIYRSPGLVQAIKDRDGDNCRYCGREVNWKDRRSPSGGTYDHVVPSGPNTIDNLVVACFRCNLKKGKRTPEQAKMPLLPASGGVVTRSDQVSHEVGSVPPVPSRPVPSRPEDQNPDQDHRADARTAHNVLVKLAHQALTEAPHDAKNQLKDLAARARIAYDAIAVTMALDVAEHQRAKLPRTVES